MKGTPKPACKLPDRQRLRLAGTTGKLGLEQRRPDSRRRESLLVDTLYDLALTDRMLRAMRQAEPVPGL